MSRAPEITQVYRLSPGSLTPDSELQPVGPGLGTSAPGTSLTLLPGILDPGTWAWPGHINGAPIRSQAGLREAPTGATYRTDNCLRKC